MILEAIILLQTCLILYLFTLWKESQKELENWRQNTMFLNKRVKELQHENGIIDSAPHIINHKSE